MLELERWHFTVDDFHRMVEAGLFTDDDRVELINGELVAMSPTGSRHSGCVTALTTLFAPLLVQRAALLSVQGPLRLNERNELYPDLLLLRPRDDDYRLALPGPGDVFLLIEVSETTLRLDREVKVPLYAEAGVPEVWVVDLTGGRLLVHRDPVQGEYSVHPVRRGQSIAPAAFSDLQLSIDGILG
ncbi:MAG: Uma2 family endonuclease [Chloroflexi bacterium]|nr:Uma2 family endonuclease [Chloroflexota bacterium]